MRNSITWCWILVATLSLPQIVARADDCVHPERDDTGPLKIVALGSLMAIPTYVLGVTWHEGSHAVAAELMGGNVTEFSILPEHHPIDGHLTFGHTNYNSGKICGGGTDGNGVLQLTYYCPFSTGKDVFITVAPKITDLTLMGFYTALNETNHLPSNLYARIAMSSIAVGAWVDFSKDLLATSNYDDVNRVYKLLGQNPHDKTNPYALTYLGLTAISGAGVGRGVYKLLTRREASPKKHKPGQTERELLLTPQLIGVGGTF
ncbi:MAG: hypothetical protein HY074_09395 [Deltaproteobacteria bacterium]|nr:hypothetical protein [Deltaproteobacteria bacterium]